MEDNSDAPDQPLFEGYHFQDPKCRGRKGPKLANILKSADHARMRKLRRVAMSRYFSELRRVPRSDLPSSPIKESSIDCDDFNSEFMRRSITTIHEEMVLFRTKANSSRKEKDYKDKVASLTNVVRRLREMGVADSVKAQKKPSEDVAQQLSDIQL